MVAREQLVHVEPGAAGAWVAHLLVMRLSEEDHGIRRGNGKGGEGQGFGRLEGERQLVEGVDHVQVGEYAVVLDLFDLVLHVRDRVLGAKDILVYGYVIATEADEGRRFFRGDDEVLRAGGVAGDEVVLAEPVELLFSIDI